MGVAQVETQPQTVAVLPRRFLCLIPFLVELLGKERVEQPAADRRRPVELGRPLPGPRFAEHVDERLDLMVLEREAESDRQIVGDPGVVHGTIRFERDVEVLICPAHWGCFLFGPPSCSLGCP